jgi:hypothetical protein
VAYIYPPTRLMTMFVTIGVMKGHRGSYGDGNGNGESDVPQMATNDSLLCCSHSSTAHLLPFAGHLIVCLRSFLCLLSQHLWLQHCHKSDRRRQTEGTETVEVKFLKAATNAQLCIVDKYCSPAFPYSTGHLYHLREVHFAVSLIPPVPSHCSYGDLVVTVY